MKTLTKAKQLLLTLLLFPLALAHVWCRRTWCFYDLPDELKSILAATTGEVKSFIERQSDAMQEMKTRVLTLEQAGVRNPRSDFGGGGAGELARLITQSDGLKAFLGGSAPSVKIEIPTRLLKSNILNVNPLSTSQPLVQGDRQAQIFYAPQRTLRIADILPSVETNSNLIEFARELVFTSNAGPQGGTTSPDEVTEGETKPESALTFELVTAAVITLAHFIPASRQILSDAPMLEQHLSQRLTYGLMLVEETNLLTGNGLQGQLQGLVSMATSFTGGATNQTAIDSIAKSIQQLTASEFTATHIVLNPQDWMNLVLLKDTTGRYLFSDPQTLTTPNLFGVPVVLTNSMTAGNFLTLDANRAGFVARREVANVRIAEQHSDFFTKNLLAIMAEERLALAVTSQAAIIYGALSYAG